MATKSIEKGEDWESSVHSNLKESFAFVPIITKDWQASQWCFAEWMAATILGKRILPLVDSKVKLRAELSKRQSIRFEKNSPNFGPTTEWIFERFKRQKEDLTKPPIPWAFRYELKDAEFFCGREREIDAIVSELNSMRHSRDRGPLFVHGSSGSGKSSLIRAGVYPMLLDTPESWVVATLFKTDVTPFDSLVKSMAQAVEGTGANKDAVSLRFHEIRAAKTVELVDEGCRARRRAAFRKSARSLNR